MRAPRRPSVVASIAAAVTLSAVATAPALADPIDDAKARIADLEQRSAVAASQSARSGQALATSRERLELFNRHVQRTRDELDQEQRELAQLARELYVNGGVSDVVANFTLYDPDEFIAQLDLLAAAGTHQNTIVQRARERALSMKAAQLAAEREHARLAQAAAVFADDQRAADEALESVRRELAAMEAEQARLQAAEEARAAIASAIVEAQAIAEQWRQIAANAADTSTRVTQSLATAPSFPSAVGGTPAAAATEDLSRYGDSAAWAASAKPQSVIMCESGGDYQINTGNGYYGAWQFDYPSWHDNGGGVFAEYPHQATKAQQDYVAWTYWLKAGWRPWECG
ncbi:MAG: transglycosylase family protein [Actinobacteria bacterium]|nr:transglycosylase family protein [Actinomycetota bacterium]MCB9413364.1 transglycosylase family protein [Actinomycetota bacterium]